MTRTKDYLYDLLPYVYRARDVEAGHALRDLLRVVGEQLDVIEEDIEGLYENWFIETCADWVVPYLGDLVGYRPVHSAGSPTAAGASARDKILVPRRDVANTIGFRRRKGTLALLEVLAGDVTGWPARAVELYRLLGWTQHLDHRRPDRGRYVDLRADRPADPFEITGHTVDVRRAVSHRTQGRYNIPSVGVFVWRLRSYPVTRTPAYCVEREGTQCYAFSVLGNDTPLFTRPVAETDPVHIAEEINVPTPIRRRAFEHRLSEHPLTAEASSTYYGPGASVLVEVQDWPRRGDRGAIAAQDVVPANLSDWHHYRAPRDKVLLDPERGRLVFAVGQTPKRVAMTYQYGFSADIGGGEYDRPLSQPLGATVYRVRQRETGEDEYRTIHDALAQWRADRGADDPRTGEPPRAAVVEIADSGVYEERLELALDPGESLQLRAANRARPVLRLLDYRVDQPDPFSVRGGAASRFVLDGLLVTGRGITVTQDEHGDLCDITIRHCTLVPGWDLDCDCEPARPEEPSLTLDNTHAKVRIEHSIVGSIWVIADERRTDPVELGVADSIVDATSADGRALCSSEGNLAFALVTVARSTVVGEVAVHAIARAENSIFTSPVRVARRQVECVRYCYVPPGSRTPRRYECQPPVGAEESEPGRLRPFFESRRYGTPTYLQLMATCADEIARGADDGSELGVFHDLYQPQRADNLRARLDEYTPAGMDAGIICAS